MKQKFNVTITFKNVLSCLKMTVKEWRESRSEWTRPPTSDMLHLSSLQLEDSQTIQNCPTSIEQQLRSFEARTKVGVIANLIFVS